MAEGAEIFVDQVNNRIGQRQPIVVAQHVHHAEIDIAESAKSIGPTGEGKQVAGVGVGVEIAEFEQLAQPGNHPGAHQGGGIELVALQQFPVLQLHPSQPGGGQHAAAAEHPLHLRHHHGGVVFKQLGEAFGVVGFELVVDFAKQRLTELINDGGEVVAEVERQEWS